MRWLETPLQAYSRVLRSQSNALTGIGLFIGITMALLASGAVSALHYLFPAMSVALGLFLLWAWPRSYLAFTFWLWILSPLIRRIVTFYSVPVDPDPILLAPVIVSALVAPLALQVLKRHTKGSTPFLLAAGGIACGLVIGLCTHSLRDVLQAGLGWAAPLCFGVYIAYGPGSPTSKFDLLRKNFIWAVAIMGAYGIFQFLAAPTWDCAWLEHNNTLYDTGEGSFGRPEQLGLRVWSTLNSPGAFGFVMMCGLLLLFSVKHWVRFPVAVVGYGAFLLSLHRASWVGWCIGSIILFFWNKKERASILSFIAVPLIIIVPILGLMASQEVISERLQTFTDLKNDGSINARVQVHEEALEYIGTNPLGTGLSSTYEFKNDTVDGGFITILLKLGWLGGGLFVASLMWLTVIAFLPSDKSGSDLFLCRAMLIAIVTYIASGDIASGVQGFLLWTCAGLLVSMKRPQDHGSTPLSNLLIVQPNIEHVVMV